MEHNHPSLEWGIAIVEEMVSAGVETMCIAPGSRSTSLVVAAAAHPKLTTYSILDERSAGFVALGIAKRTGRPVAICTTSGTATANIHPAVLEADRSRTPLLVCTADRPPELHGIGANQTIDQRDLFGGAVRWAPHLPVPTRRSKSQQSLRAIVASAIARSRHPYPGPVHLNIPFRKPFGPEDFQALVAECAEHADSKTPPFDYQPNSPEVVPQEGIIDRIVDLIEAATRGSIVVGPIEATTSIAAVQELAEWTGFPLFVDALSGLRFGTGVLELSMGGYDGFLDPTVCGRLPAPDFVLKFGARPTSVHLQTFLAGHDGHVIQVDPVAEYQDPHHATTDLIAATPTSFVTSVVERLESPKHPTRWGRVLLDAESTYWETLDQHNDQLPPEGRVIAEAIAAAPPGATVFVSNSMPIRDVDRFVKPTSRPLHIVGNRGVSGIDGILSTGIGAGIGGDGSSIILTGDLAFVHDLSGLATINRCDVSATIVVLNNAGGGIFHNLPIAANDPPFSALFKTPHGLDFRHVARLYDLAYMDTQPADFDSTFKEALALEETMIIDVEIDAAENHEQRSALQQIVREGTDFREW